MPIAAALATAIPATTGMATATGTAITGVITTTTAITDITEHHRHYSGLYGYGYWPGIYAGTGYGYRRCYSPVYGWYPCSYRYYGYNY